MRQIRDKVIKPCKIAIEVLEEVQEKHRGYANTSAKHINLKPDEDVLLLLPDKTDTIAITWQGPFKVFIKISDAESHPIRSQEKSVSR